MIVWSMWVSIHFDPYYAVFCTVANCVENEHVILVVMKLTCIWEVLRIIYLFHGLVYSKLFYKFNFSPFASLVPASSIVKKRAFNKYVQVLQLPSWTGGIPSHSWHAVSVDCTTVGVLCCYLLFVLFMWQMYNRAWLTETATKSPSPRKLQNTELIFLRQILL
jgi:hypothetical protein